MYPENQGNTCDRNRADRRKRHRQYDECGAGHARCSLRGELQNADESKLLTQCKRCVRRLSEKDRGGRKRQARPIEVERIARGNDKADTDSSQPKFARTVAVNAITIGQVFYLLNSRYLLDSSFSFTAHLGNKYLPLGIGAVVILQLLFTYAPPLQRLFDNEAIPLRVWPWLLLGGLVFFLLVEAEKLIIRSSGSLRSAVTAVEAGATT